MESNSETISGARGKFLFFSFWRLVLIATLLGFFSANDLFANLRDFRTRATLSAFPLNRSLSRLGPASTPLWVGPNVVSSSDTGKSGILRVIASRNDSWTVTNSNPWIVINPSSGRGSQWIKYTVSPNADCLRRTGIFSINGRTVTINQASAPKNYSLSTSQAVFTAEAAAGSVALSADCVWSIQTDADWISTIAPASDNGEGDATIVYTVAANSASAPRTGLIKILDGNSVVRQTFSVTQQGAAPVSYAFSPATAEFLSEGGSNSIELITSETAAWTLKVGKGFSNVFPTNGTGSATIHYSVLPNSSAEARSSSMIVLDSDSITQHTFSVTIAPVGESPSYTLSSSYLVFTASGATVSVGLDANSSWAAQSDVNWINNISPASGNGDATIHYSIAPNTTSGSRTGTLKILDGNSVVQQTLRVTQGGLAANFALSSTNENFAANGGTASVVLAANASWRILTDVNWITGISPISGNSNATINYSISPNTNCTPRSSSIRILDGNFVVQKTLVITQEGAPENYSLASRSNSPSGYRWSGTLGTAGNDVGSSVATDSVGNVFVTGNLDSHLFVEKYSAVGNLIWSKSFYDNHSSGNAIAVDQNNNVVVAGTFYSAIDLGGGALGSAGEYDAFVAKFSSDGAHLWSKTFGGSEGDDVVGGVAVDSTGNILATGTIVGTVALGGNTTYATGPFDNDIVLAKFSAGNGSVLWSKRFASSSGDNGLSVSASPLDEVIVTGNFSG